MPTLRSIVRSVLSLSLCLVFLSPISSSFAAEYIASDVSQRVGAATVMVHVEYEDTRETQVSWGTGFIIGHGVIMTNAHVVSDRVPTRIYVHNAYLPVTEARVLAARYDTDGDGASHPNYFDVALLTYTPPANIQLPVLPFSLGASTNQDIFAFGFPGNESTHLEPQYQYVPGGPPRAPLSITGGTINQVIQANPALLMHDALCKTGNSGGPLINERGEVVGMQTWSADPDPRNVVLSFAIGSRGLVSFAQQAGYRPYIVE